MPAPPTRRPIHTHARCLCPAPFTAACMSPVRTWYSVQCRSKRPVAAHPGAAGRQTVHVPEARSPQAQASQAFRVKRRERTLRIWTRQISDGERAARAWASAAS